MCTVKARFIILKRVLTVSAYPFVRDALAKLSNLLTESNGASPFDSRSDARRCAAYLVVLMAEAIKTDPALKTAFGDEIQVLRNTVAHAMTEDLIDSPGFKRYLLESFLPSSHAILAGQATSDVIGSIPRPDRPSEEDMVCNTRVLVKKISDETPADWIAQGARCYTMLSLTESFVQSTTSSVRHLQFKVNDARNIRQQFSHPIKKMTEETSIETVLQDASTFDSGATQWLAAVTTELLKEEEFLETLLLKQEKPKEETSTESLEHLQEETALLWFCYKQCEHVRAYIGSEITTRRPRNLTLLAEKMLEVLVEQTSTSGESPQTAPQLKRLNHKMAVLLFNYICMQHISAFTEFFMQHFSGYLIEQEKLFTPTLVTNETNEISDDVLLSHILSPLRVAALTLTPANIIEKYFFKKEPPVTPEKGIVPALLTMASNLGNEKRPISENLPELIKLLLEHCNTKTLRDVFTPFYLLQIASTVPHAIKLAMISAPGLAKYWNKVFVVDENAPGASALKSFNPGEFTRDYLFSDLPETDTSRAVTEILNTACFPWKQLNTLGETVLICFHRRLENSNLLSEKDAITLRELAMHEKIDLFAKNRQGLTVIECGIEYSRHLGGEHQALEILLEAAYQRDPKQLFSLLDKSIVPSDAGKMLFTIMEKLGGAQDTVGYREALIRKTHSLTDAKFRMKTAPEIDELFLTALIRTKNNEHTYKLTLPDKGKVNITKSDIITLYSSCKRYELNANTASPAYTALIETLGLKTGDEPKKALLRRYYENSRDAIAVRALTHEQASPSSTRTQVHQPQPPKRKGKGKRK